MRLYFENPVGRVLEHPDGYALVQYHPGPRKLHHLQAFLTHTVQLLRLRNWDRMLGDQRQMEPFTPEENEWVLGYWLSEENQGHRVFGAVLLAEEDFAQLPAEFTRQDGEAAALTYHLFANEAAATSWLLGTK
ncbi:hypothetical protein LRS06_02295 [Hymenobacter sp. J193]|uniref:hypothetical protein n=1 Tax=Hymenobacter sp. J193 TaxID=2898429 RepID=UPI002151D0BA|nr:hypothetical protein [Hymenobacter sp. J193]MCR5886622.1 hypothetical protein [Hymenobacter sp. J193]